MPTERGPLTRLQAPRKIPVTVTMMSETTRWAAPLALTRVLLVGLCVCWPLYTNAEDTERGPSQDQAQTAHTVEAIRLAAEQGDVSAQNDLGTMYQNGEGVPQNVTEALRWFRLAADQGFAGAQVNLGVAYQNGLGVPQDGTEALRWFRLAADQGFAGAQVNLGVAYQNGLGVQPDGTEALRWYRLAAEQGNASAQVHLGVMYQIGRGVPQDDVAAHMWFNLASAQSSGDERDFSVQLRDDVAAGMTAEQIAEAQRLAREWKPTVQP